MSITPSELSVNVEAPEPPIAPGAVCAVREIAMRWQQLKDDAEWLVEDICTAGVLSDDERVAQHTINRVIDTLANDCPRLFRSPLRKRKVVRRG